VDEENVSDGSGWWRDPNGTGPFRLGRWDENSLFTLERNELYYGETARLDEVVYQLYAGQPMNLYETGEIDVAGISSSYIDRVRDPAGTLNDQWSTTPELSFYYIGFNSNTPPFDDPDIRRAFSLAIDKDKIISLVYRDMVARADGILPPGMPGYNENLTRLEFDVARAKEMIADSTYGDVANLPEITITTSGYGGSISSLLESIIYQWRQNLGVNVKVRQLEPERYLYHLQTEKDEMFFFGWIADYPHPQDFLEVLFRSGADNNYGGYSSTEVDRLLAEAGSETDYERGLDLYREAEQLLVDEAACLPLCFGQNYLLTKPYVNNYNLNPLGFVQLNLVSVDPH
jgi:oligopeptide transport system substrate-binding protein